MTRLTDRMSDWNIPEDEAVHAPVMSNEPTPQRSPIATDAPSPPDLSQQEACGGLQLKDTVLAGPGVVNALKLFDLEGVA